VLEQQHLHFCDLCLKGRKVFISEQVLYSKRDLDRHNRTGDDAGPLAEAGFKGHPPCHFCRRRFYDSNELYNHMERDHEHCFLCRRANPNKYVYFKDYAELDAHFMKDHHPCPHPACIERRFVVFPQEAELKRHFATEHGEEMRMSRAQRREALAVPINLQYASATPARRGGGGSGGRDEQGAAAAAIMERPGIVMGGGAGLQPRGGRQGGGGGMRNSRSDPAMAAAVAASAETAAADGARRAAAAEARPAPPQQPEMGSVTFNASDFPSVGGMRPVGAPAGSGVSALGTWVAAGGGGVGGGGGGAGPSGGAALGAEDFPELPSMSKSQKQRQRQKAKAATSSIASRMAAASAAPRVLNRATPGASGSGSGGLAASHSTGSLQAAAAAVAPPPTSSSAAASDDEGAAGAGDFPALDGGAGPSQLAHPSWVPVRSRAPRPAGNRSAAAAAPAPREADFPALGGGRGGGGGGSSSRPAGRGAGAAPAPTAAPSAAAAAAAVAARQGGVSEELKAANRALVERIKAQLDAAGFASFREQSAAFMRGAKRAEAYHDLIVSLGLLPLVAQLAELCPEPERREGLLRAHRTFLESERAHDAVAVGPGWVPPEAALAAARRAEQQASWPCAACTLINAPSSRACEACGALRTAAAAAAAGGKQEAAGGGGSGAGGRSAAAVLAAPSPYDAAPVPSFTGRSSAAPAPAAAAPSRGEASWPSLGGGAGSGGAGTSGASSSAAAADGPAPAEAEADVKGKGRKKPVKQTLQQLLQSGRSAPGNAWSQPQRTTALGAAPAVAQPKGAWGGKSGGGDKLSRQLRATGLGER
jgi:hypothetical protein